MNVSKKKSLKEVVKDFKKSPSAESLAKVFQTLDKSAKSGIIKKNTASRLKSRLSAVFAKREHALTFSMQVVKALPILNVGNVQCFRIRQGGYPAPLVDGVPLANEKDLVPAVTFSIGCELVFSTGGRL